jgi:diguanylate cyclase (GGDEF)-like protein
MPFQTESKIYKFTIRFLIVVFVAIVGYFDHLSGTELAFSFFYLIPVAAAAWWQNRTFSLAVAFLCAVTSWMVEAISGFSLYQNHSFAIWNALLRLGIFIFFVFLLDSLKNKVMKLADLAHEDPNTGILNARGFYETGRQLLEKSQGQGFPVALAYLDLDDFKQVNDSRGHLEGDRFLKLVAHTLSTGFSKNITAGRLGGDEFALFIFGLMTPQIDQFFQKLRSNLNSRIQSEGFSVTFSIGVTIHVEPPTDLEALVHEADSLMYEAKRSGKNALKIMVH